MFMFTCFMFFVLFLTRKKFSVVGYKFVFAEDKNNKLKSQQHAMRVEKTQKNKEKKSKPKGKT